LFSSKLYHVGFIEKKQKRANQRKKFQKNRTSSKSFDRVNNELQEIPEEVMPKKPNEIFEIRMQKIKSDKRQLFIVLEILE